MTNLYVIICIFYLEINRFICEIKERVKCQDVIGREIW